MTTQNVDRVEQLIALCPNGEDFIIRNKCNDDIKDQCRRIRMAFHSAAHDIHEYVFSLTRTNGLIFASLLDGKPSDEEMEMLRERIEHHTGHEVVMDSPSRLLLPEDLTEALKNDLA